MDDTVNMSAWRVRPRLMDGSAKWQTYGRKITSCDGSVSVPAGDKVLLVPPSLSNIDTGNLLHSSEAKLNDSSLSSAQSQAEMQPSWHFASAALSGGVRCSQPPSTSLSSFLFPKAHGLFPCLPGHWADACLG